MKLTFIQNSGSSQDFKNYKMPKAKTNIATKLIDSLDPKVLDILNSILS